MEVSGVMGGCIYAVTAFIVGLAAYLLLPRLINLTTHVMANNAIGEASGMQEVLLSEARNSKWIPVSVASVASAFSLLSFCQYGFTISSCLLVLLSLSLLIAVAIDLRHQLLPDLITLPIMWVGLLVNITGTFALLQDAVIGAAAGYASLYIISRGFSVLTGRVGMGDGDLKLLALLGAWGGWQVLP